LWSRLRAFVRDRLTGAIDRGELVKATLMRATLHLVSAREYPEYSLATLDGRFGAWRPPGSPLLAEFAAVRRSVLKLAAKAPLTRAEIQRYIAEHMPKAAAEDERLRSWSLWAAITTSGVVWEPAGAHFEYRTLARFVAPPAALRRRADPEDAYDLVVRRHLGAFGPASVADIATWSSMRTPRIRAALARLTGIRRFVDERGRELFDLARAPRPHEDTPAPVRYLARFDAAILGHDAAERTRILPERYRKQVIFSAEVWPTFLVDGFVAGRWTIAVRPKETIIELRPFGRLARADRAALVEEGERLARFYAPESASHGVRA
ncbi:MAG: winged helix DNA-binding domain-containing protein, partial [Chloroflexota bacterium]